MITHCKKPFLSLEPWAWSGKSISIYWQESLEYSRSWSNSFMVSEMI